MNIVYSRVNWRFLLRDATQSAVMRLYVVCLSVRDVEVCF